MTLRAYQTRCDSEDTHTKAESKAMSRDAHEGPAHTTSCSGVNSYKASVLPKPGCFTSDRRAGFLQPSANRMAWSR
jgi:hypothetical protein